MLEDFTIVAVYTEDGEAGEEIITGFTCSDNNGRIATFKRTR